MSFHYRFYSFVFLADSTSKNCQIAPIFGEIFKSNRHVVNLRVVFSPHLLCSVRQSCCSILWTMKRKYVAEHSVVRELAEAVLAIERGIDRKYLKPPLGK